MEKLTVGELIQLLIAIDDRLDVMIKYQKREQDSCKDFWKDFWPSRIVDLENAKEKLK